jgi:uncharacterized membrane protein YdcZ (DUF606 family)
MTFLIIRWRDEKIGDENWLGKKTRMWIWVIGYVLAAAVSTARAAVAPKLNIQIGANSPNSEHRY